MASGPSVRPNSPPTIQKPMPRPRRLPDSRPAITGPTITQLHGAPTDPRARYYLALAAAQSGDDRGAAPLLLYVGQKDHHGDGSFLDRNGLAHGALYAWVADDGSLSPEDWNGTGTSRTGTFVEIAHYDDAMARDFFDELGIPEPDVDLGIGSGSHGDQTGRMLAALEVATQFAACVAHVIDGSIQ